MLGRVFHELRPRILIRTHENSQSFIWSFPFSRMSWNSKWPSSVVGAFESIQILARWKAEQKIRLILWEMRIFVQSSLNLLIPNFLLLSSALTSTIISCNFLCWFFHSGTHVRWPEWSKDVIPSIPDSGTLKCDWMFKRLFLPLLQTNFLTNWIDCEAFSEDQCR